MKSEDGKSLHAHGYTIQSKLHIQCNPHQNSNNIPHSGGKINPKVFTETQNTLNSQGNIEQK
jgi:hypothetical protein